MASRSVLFQSLESRRLLAVLVPTVGEPVGTLPAYADKMNLGNVIDPVPTFRDEFDGNALDSSKWQIREASRWRPSPDSEEFAWTHRNSVRVRGGELELVAHNDPATGQLRSGWIQTAQNSDTPDPKLIPGSTANFQQAYGFWEAKLKMGAVSGMWSAFWVHSPKMVLVGDDASRANHPEIYGTEMDVTENGAIRGGSPHPNDSSSVIHANGYGAHHVAGAAHIDTTTQPLGLPPSEYHVYGLMWTPGKVTFYLDGNAVYSTVDANLISKVPQLIILSNEIGSPGSSKIGEGRSTWGHVPDGGFGNIDQSKAKMTADYVRVWKLSGTVVTTPTTTKPLVPTKPFVPTTRTTSPTTPRLSPRLAQPFGGTRSAGLDVLDDSKTREAALL